MPPDIDVSDVILNSVVAGETFTVVRRQEIVNAYGESVLTESRVDAIGSIQPTGDNSMTREDAYTLQANSIRVITSFLLRGAGQSGGLKYQPDLVFWNDGYYIAKSESDYSHYGRGQVEVDMISFNYQPPGPTPLPPAVGTMDFSVPPNSGLIGSA